LLKISIFDLLNVFILAEVPNINSSGGSSVIKDFQLTTDVKSKSDPSFGKAISKYIYSTVGGTSSYYWVRNARFKANRDIANGRINMSKFMDRLEFNGQVNFANLGWQCIKIANTVVSRMVGAWMGRGEKINVQAVDLKSKEDKKKQADEAEFVMQHKDQLAVLEQESGAPMIPQDQFIAEDKDELEEWKLQFNQLPEEIGYELGVNAVFEANGLFGVIKEKLLHDSCEVGLVGTYTEMNEDGEIVTEWVKPENCLYSYSEYPDFRDTTWRGRVRSFKISYLRQKYGVQNGGTLTEQDLWSIAQLSKSYQLSDKITWLDQWSFAFLRPYDEWNIDGIDFEFKSYDSDNYTVTKTKKNNSTLINKGVPEKIKDNQKVITDNKYNIYRGVYIPLSDTLLEWGLKKNMIIPQDPKEIGNAEFSYSFYMYQNYNMRNIAVPEKIEEPLDQMIIARLKIQQLVAKMKPAGAAINVDAMNELDLGLANTSKPLEVQKIWEQTGNLYYRGRDAEGNQIPLPITELPNAGFAAQLQALIQDYQFHFQVLKDELGQDPNLAQQAAQPRVANSNIQQSIQQSNDASDYMYDGYLYCLEDTGKKVAALLNKSVTYGAKKYREILKEDDVKGRVFETSVKMLPTNEEIAKLELMMNTAITNLPQLVAYIDPFKIIRIAKVNIKLAELLFRQGQKRYLKTEQQINQQNSQQNAQIQQASIEAKAKADDELFNKKTQAEERLELLRGSFSVISKGLPIPSDLNNVLAGVIKNMSMPLMMENAQMEQEMAQAAQQQIQEQQEQSQTIESQEPQLQQQEVAA
jgi:hypothetical protein